MYHGRTTGKGLSTATQIYQQPPRILIIHITLPSWADICSNLCEALQNFFSLACGLMGPSRMSLFSLYMVQNQHECILPFVQVKGNFARLQACISELRMLQREGCFRPQTSSLKMAVEDGLQQFKQYSRHVTTGTVLTYTSPEITILTSQPGKEVVKQLEEGLKDTDLLRVRRLQVVEISKKVPEDVDSVSPVEEPSNDACLKCDLQERLLSPSLLPGTADGSLRMDDPKGIFGTLYQLTAQSSACHYKLRVIKALKSSGVCESLTYGLPIILKPTSCWKLDWDELESNQQHFHALCHSLLKREWLLLAKGESSKQGHNPREPACTFYVIMPSRSLTLLVKAVATRELLLPSPFPLLSEDPPDDSLKAVESMLDGLELESTYNPLQIRNHLYSYLNSIFVKSQGRLHPSWESQAQRKVQFPSLSHLPPLYAQNSRGPFSLLLIPNP
ncbi:meiosis 1 arrest protein isoform X3 [Erinaceus europaeus]|uniref:Meiosis 1 arrest protein isoform X3 n=1 Tax=Erinaceus europaeus TaxID=9365 RepID=A0ABM3X3Z8_ERIEU|nr:meiosis 1 arrest protein isoform X3 [Erinaceus europaeus]